MLSGDAKSRRPGSDANSGSLKNNVHTEKKTLAKAYGFPLPDFKKESPREGEMGQDNLPKSQDKSRILKLEGVTIDQSAIKGLLKQWNPKWSKEKVETVAEEAFKLACAHPKEFNEMYE